VSSSSPRDTVAWPSMTQHLHDGAVPLYNNFLERKYRQMIRH
jgi:hypothetical protein